jgi:hypothetical protein
MKFLRKLLLIFFDLTDELYHQKRIKKFIRKIEQTDMDRIIKLF